MPIFKNRFFCSRLYLNGNPFKDPLKKFRLYIELSIPFFQGFSDLQLFQQDIEAVSLFGAIDEVIVFEISEGIYFVE